MNVEALYPCHVPAKVEAAFENTLFPEKVLLSVRRVEEADDPPVPVIPSEDVETAVTRSDEFDPTKT